MRSHGAQLRKVVEEDGTTVLELRRLNLRSFAHKAQDPPPGRNCTPGDCWH